MPLYTPGVNAEASGVTAIATHLALHTADPTSAGSNQTTHARVAASWPAPTNGVVTVTNKPFTGGASNGPVTWVGLWTAATGGSCVGAYQIPTGAGNDLTSNAAGNYTLTSIQITFT